jgi:hypothetical protein
LSSGKSSAVATPISFVINASASPALAAMNGTLVAVIPINAPAPDLPVSLAAYTSTDGATWDGPFLIGEMPTYKNGGAGAATGPDGQIYVMFGDADKNRVRISSSEDAVAWSDPGVLKGAYTSIQPSLTFTGETLVCAHPGNKSAFVWWNEATP